MNFRVDRWSATALRRSGVALATVVALLLASCGGSGSSSQSEQFSPTRIIVFGDEQSLLLPPSSPTAVDAGKYAIRGFNASVIDCRVNPVWVQRLASEFDLVFPECNPDGLTATGQMRATVGAKVADAIVQIDTFLASSSFGRRDLVTVMVGTHDIIELADAVANSTLTEGAAVIEAERRASLLADQFDRITNTDNTRGRALYVPVPDVGESPYGLAGGSERVRILKEISEAFNNELRGNVPVNGRSIGLVNAFQIFRNVVRLVDDGDTPAGFVNATEEACTVSILSCTTNTTRAPADVGDGPTEFSWVWAKDFYLSAGGQSLLGEEAIDIATDNPF